MNFNTLLENATDDFKLIDSINDPQHFRLATRQLLKHKYIFFKKDALKHLESGDEALREATLKDAIPAAKLLWHFCVLLCRELFNGEHRMTAADAQLLGLVDEVAGGSYIESRRDFRRGQQKSSES